MTSPDPAAILAQINAAREQTYQNIALAQGILDQANQAAAAAAQDRAAIQAIAQQTVRVDTTVGTRVFAGDTMIYGDTGWREVSSLLVNGWTARFMHIRRIGDMAYLRATLLSGANATAGEFLPVIPDFYRWPGGSDSQVATPDGYNLRIGGNSGYLSLNTTAGLHHFTVMWPTYQAWPTSLPGTPV